MENFFDQKFLILIFGCRFLRDIKKFVEKSKSKYVNSHIYNTFPQVQCNQGQFRPFANKFQEESDMKNTKKTTIVSLISDLNRWYGPHWWQGGLVLFVIFFISVIIPGIFG